MAKCNSSRPSVAFSESSHAGRNHQCFESSQRIEAQPRHDPSGLSHGHARALCRAGNAAGHSGKRARDGGWRQGFDTADFVLECRNMWVTPHVAQNLGRRGGSAIVALWLPHVFTSIDDAADFLGNSLQVESGAF